MKRKFSLKRNEEIAQIVKKRTLIKNDCFNIYYQKNELDYSRICISVSKKRGNAVTRNKIKRQVREMIDKIFKFNEGMDYVIIIKEKFLENTFIENKEKLSELYWKLNPNKE